MITASLFLALLPAAPDIELDFAVGTLGKEVIFEVEGTPGGTALLLPGVNAGPTLVPCGLGVAPVGGLILPQIAAISLDATGSGQNVKPLPVLAGLVGLPLYATSLEVDATAGCLFTDVSNSLRFRLLETATAELLIGEMNVARQYHGLTQLPSERLVLTGGTPPGGGLPTDTIETYDPRTETFSLSPLTLLRARSRHEQILLDDGRILVIGGLDDTGIPTNTSELIDFTAGIVTSAGAMISPRVEFSAIKLPDGTVFALGGFSGAYSADHPLGFPGSILGTVSKPALLAFPVERWDPLGEAWSPVQTNLPPSAGAAATLLDSGAIWITGGLVLDPMSQGFRSSDRSQLLNPQTAQLSDLLPIPDNRAFHGQVAKLGGGALVSGGRELSDNGTGTGPQLSPVVPVSFEFDPTVPQSPYSIAPPDLGQSLRLILICVEGAGGAPRYVRVSCPDDTIDGGGFPDTVRPIPAVGGDEIWGQDGTGAWVPIGTLIASRPGHRAAYLVSRDRVVITGSADPPNPSTSNPDRTGEEISVL